MARTLDASERNEAALLDSIHAAEHTWVEFDLVTRLVCPGGLILIHDACSRRRHGGRRARAD